MIDNSFIFRFFPRNGLRKNPMRVPFKIRVVVLIENCQFKHVTNQSGSAYIGRKIFVGFPPILQHKRYM
jgi:hypothetical protein